MTYLTRGYFGVVLAIGSAFAILRALDGDRSSALVIGAVAVVAALVVFMAVDRPRAARRRG